MTGTEILQVISDNFLCVRRLPFETITYWSYKDGDENKKYINSDGKPITAKREVVIQYFDLEHFQRTKPSKFCTDSPEIRFSNWRKHNPNGRKLLKETKTIEKGGWWYVKPVNNTSSMVRFNREYDEFFAPTLEEAVQLFLNSKQ